MGRSDVLPRSIRAINALPLSDKRAIYSQLIPEWVLHRYRIDPQSLLQDGKEVVHIKAPEDSRVMEVSIYDHPNALDPLTYLNMIDTFNNQLMVLLVIINDPESPRFNTDVDEDGNDTHFGTRSRNLRAELLALEAGLAPGQVRMGLRAFKSTVPLFESFVRRMGHDLFMIEPLSYHNAVVFERYGFSYTYGRKEMETIHEGFQPGGVLYNQLDDENPFRRPDAWTTVRGRSWAIHDGILGHAFTAFQMYKRVGIHAGVNTFPDGRW